MKTNRRLIACVGFVLFFAAGASLLATTTFEGTVKDPNGHLMRGALVRVMKEGKIVSRAKTDANGHYTTAALAPGVYQIDLVVGSIVVARYDSAKAEAMTEKGLDFELKNAARKIWVVDTGTNIGRWVYLDDPSSWVPMHPVYKTDASWLQRMQDRTTGTIHALPGVAVSGHY